MSRRPSQGLGRRCGRDATHGPAPAGGERPRRSRPLLPTADMAQRDHEGELRAAKRATIRESLFWLCVLAVASVMLLLCVRNFAVAPGRAWTMLGLLTDIVGVLMLGRGALLDERITQKIGTYGWLSGDEARRLSRKGRYVGYAGLALAVIGFAMQFVGAVLP